MMRIPFVLPVAVTALALAAPIAAQTTLNVRDADIRAFIADAARVTGRTFIVDARVAGKVTVVTDRPLSRSEYFEVFLSTLRANGLVAVPTGNGVLRIQPIDNAASQPSRIGSAGAQRNSFVTEVVRLRSIDAQSAVETVRPLVSAQGSVTANRGGNSLVVVDFADNIRRVREVLRRVDTDGASTRIVALRNASAREIATALQSLAGSGGAPGAGGGGASGVPGTVSVVAIESSNSIGLRGDPTSVARLAQIAADLDRKAQSGTEIKVVFLENADAEQLFARAPAPRRADPRPGAGDDAVARQLPDDQFGDRRHQRLDLAPDRPARCAGIERGWRRIDHNQRAAGADLVGEQPHAGGGDALRRGQRDRHRRACRHPAPVVGGDAPARHPP